MMFAASPLRNATKAPPVFFWFSSGIYTVIHISYRRCFVLTHHINYILHVPKIKM